MHGRAGVALTDAADHFELRGGFAVLVALGVFLAAAANAHIEMRRERVHHGYAHAVQAAGELVVLVAELTARVQTREDQLDAADFFLRMNVDGHAAAVVHHFERIVFEQRDGDFLGVPRQCFVDAVVDDLVRQMVRARGVRVHAWPAPHGLQAAQDFDVGRGVRRAHCSDLSEKKRQAEGARRQTRAGI